MDQPASSVIYSKRPGAIKTILLTGFIAGTLDMTAAIITFAIRSGGKPIRVLHYIASAVFGTKAFSGGLMIAFWGLIFHFIIAYAFTIFFFLVYPKINLLKKNIVVTGLVYGLLIWLFMNLIVLPMTNVARPAFTVSGVLIGIIILMLFIGLLIALIIHRFFQRNRL